MLVSFFFNTNLHRWYPKLKLKCEDDTRSGLSPWPSMPLLASNMPGSIIVGSGQQWMQLILKLSVQDRQPRMLLICELSLRDI